MNEYSTRGLPIRNPLLSEKEKQIVEFIENTPDISVLEPGERTLIKFLRKAEKDLKRARIVTEFFDNTFICYYRKFEKEFCCEIDIYMQDGMFVMENHSENDGTSMIVPFSDFYKIIAYLYETYASEHKNGKLVTR